MIKTKSSIGTCLGQLSWHISNINVETYLTQFDGHRGAITFRLDKRDIKPLPVAPWTTERHSHGVPVVLRAHRTYRQVTAEHFGIDAGQPLIAIPVRTEFRDVRFPLRWDNAKVILAGCHPLSGGAGYLVRLFNVSRKSAQVVLSWAESKKLSVEKCGLFGRHRQPQPRQFKVASLDFVNVIVHPH